LWSSFFVSDMPAFLSQYVCMLYVLLLKKILAISILLSLPVLASPSGAAVNQSYDIVITPPIL
jgi:hypothetical protein